MIKILYFLFSFFFQHPTDKVIKGTGGTFDVNIEIIITQDTAKARKEVLKYYDCSSCDFDCRGVTFPSTDGGPVIMWFPDLEERAVIVHESFHATRSVLTWAGLTLSDDNEEAFAYEQQYIINLIYEIQDK